MRQGGHDICLLLKCQPSIWYCCEPVSEVWKWLEIGAKVCHKSSIKIAQYVNHTGDLRMRKLKAHTMHRNASFSL